jgi:hypothetical protein
MHENKGLRRASVTEKVNMACYDPLSQLSAMVDARVMQVQKAQQQQLFKRVHHFGRMPSIR